jgi:peroxiredoxin family protein
MSAAKTSPDQLSLVVFSGTFERVHYALTMAAAAVAANTPATLFFTMGAAKALLKPDADGTPSWHKLPLAENPGTAATMNAGFAANRIATFDDLLDACIALDVTFMVCEMGLKALGIPAEDLRPDIPIASGGLVTFLADASRHGGMMFV